MTRDEKRKMLKLEFLSELERKEAELLSWGVVDGFFTEDELLELISAYLEERDTDDVYDDESEVLDVLRDEALVFELPGSESHYRSRMAEGIRLLFRLRQILHWRPWNEAQNLIADYRLLLHPRLYPKRHLTPSRVHERLGPVLDHAGLEQRVVDALVGADRDDPFKLADFQVDAARRVLDEVRKERKSGTIVCAGTGSGKTLAFYLPALVALARWSDGERWTRCLSLYPRNELLKDQLSTAVKRVREVNTILKSEGRRPLRVGAMFGAVPANSGNSAHGFDHWERRGGGHLCTYLTCPACDRMTLQWRDDDRRDGREELLCTECKERVGPELFMLTRDAMRAEPPDLLFTSLEMVNQRMSDQQLGPLLGLGQPAARRPRLVLLDEVHTYEGIYGAQAALLLRRWKQLSRAAPHFVGLSATLADARRFFADFLDEREDLVEEVSPRTRDLEGQGQEYMLALRGDPISQTNLLSASIQTAMLLRRILDANPGPGRRREGVFGTKVFGFTDNLDVINRLFHDLLDAEGWFLGRNGQLRRKPPNREKAEIPEPWLAAYRAVHRPKHDLRWTLGQSWDLCDRIGHRLKGTDPPVKVGRTSSQDAGVDESADVVIATASLEVGYDDPSVGAVLQHKAPQNAAAFLQRKGRAGRERDMRPWTVVVLSCFGRDRIAYESYEQLFSPNLQPRHLPLSNRYVLRIQAAYALMDWLSLDGVDGHVWKLLAQRPEGSFEGYSRQRQQQIKARAERLLEDDRQRRRFATYLRYALGVDPSTASSLMWDPPRSLMMSVVPTIVRRLDREWKKATPPGAQEQYETSSFWSPLPEFVPSNLFSDLNHPEVLIHLEGRAEPESMGIRQALQEFAPGRVTLRFGVASRHSRHWIPVSPEQSTVDLDDICPVEAQQELGNWSYATSEGVEDVRVVRPFALRVQRTPAEVSNSSNARLRWATQLLPPADASVVGLPAGSPWSDVVDEMGFHMHAHANPIEVRRFTLGGDFSVKQSQDEGYEGAVAFAGVEAGTAAPRPVALGYTVDTDALRFSVSVPQALYRRLIEDQALLRGTRSALFRHRLETHEALDLVSNVFQREWLARIYLGAVAMETERINGGLRDGHHEIVARNFGPLEVVLDVIFRTMGDKDDADDNTRRGQLLQIIQEPGFREALEDCAPTLWREPDETWEDWLKQRYCATLAVALREAAQDLCPELDADGLCPDIDPGVRDGAKVEHTELWLTETTLGGGGLVEALHREYTQDPRRFFDLLDAALGPNDFEGVHDELVTLLGWIHEDSERGSAVREALAQVREARTHREQLDAQLHLRQALSRYGFRASHVTMSALYARVLRPGSSPETDALLHDLQQRWDDTEARLGIEVESHVFAYLCSGSNELDVALRGLGIELGPTDAAQWRFDTLYGLFWPRGSLVRAQALQAYNPYQPLPETDRLLVLGTRDRMRREIVLGSPRWNEFLREILSVDGVAVLTASLDQRRDLSEAIRALLVEPLDLGFIMGFPRVRGLTQEGRHLSLTVEIPEVIQ